MTDLRELVEGTDSLPENWDWNKTDDANLGEQTERVDMVIQLGSAITIRDVYQQALETHVKVDSWK